jgi:drug/metabolite transporter (DMT)-like permease
MSAVSGTRASSRADAPRWADGLLPGCAGVLCFSGTAPATRIAGTIFGPATLTAGRVLIAATLGVLALLLARRLRWPGRSRLAGLLVAGTGQAAGYPLFLALAVEHVPAYHGAVVIGLTPAATAGLSALRTREHLRPRFWLACLVGSASVAAFAIMQGGGSLQVADAWLVAAVLSAAVGYVEGARVSREIGGVQTLCWAMILLTPGAAVILAVSVSSRTFPPISGSAWVAFGYAGVASMFLGSVLFYRALAVGGTARIGQLNLAQPFLAIAWSSLLLGEHLGWAVPITAAVVLACMVVCLSKPGQRASQPPSTASTWPCT